MNTRTQTQSTHTLGDQTLAWTLDVPEGVATDHLPVVLFLHGRGECGTDGQAHTRVGLLPAVHANPERWPCAIIAPQKPDPAVEWNVYESALMSMLDAIASGHELNTDRVAITGLSQGGHGSLLLAALNPGRFHRVAAVCGYSEPRFTADAARVGPGSRTSGEATVQAMASALVGRPTWLFHGDADEPIPVAESIALHSAMKAINADCTLTVYPGVGHEAWEPAYAEPELAAWLLSNPD